MIFRAAIAPLGRCHCVAMVIHASTGFRPRCSDRAVGEILRDDIRPGVGYEKSLYLLCVNKYGQKQHREKIRERLTIDHLQDEQLRLHYL